jgi:predicted  nucleic acid-binding Zn-ribbon protein
MLPDLKLVIRLQDIDTRLLGLQREISTLPKHISEIEKKLVSHERKLEVDRAAGAANQKDRKKCEGDIQVQEQKISKLKDQMLQAKTNEQYRAFQHEIEYIEKEIRGAEDRILELMSQSEPLDVNVKQAEAALKEEKQSVEAEQKRARERTAADQSQITQLRVERGETAQKLPADTLKTYERIRKKWGGLAIADATTGRCAACQITLRPQYFQDLKKGERLLTCESCGRILVYNPPVSFDGAANGVNA